MSDVDDNLGNTDGDHQTDEVQASEEEYGQFELEEQIIEASNNLESDGPDVKRLRKEDIRKPYSKWVLFCVETRPKILQENPSATFKDIASTLAAKFKTISSEDNERLEAAVAADKIRYSKEVENALPSEDTVDAKIKRAAKMDPDVKNIGRDSLIAITKATELFVGHLALKCSSNVALRGARSITENDIINVIHAVESMDFLRIDFPKPSVAEKKKIAGNKSKAAGEATAAPASGRGIMEMMANAKPKEYISEEVSQLTPSQS